MLLAASTCNSRRRDHQKRENAFGQLPSFTSFAQHKKFLLKHVGALGQDEPYAEYMRKHTGWFDGTVKMIRDQFVVHASPVHMRFFGIPGTSHEYGMFILLPKDPNAAKAFAQVQAVSLTIPRLARDVEGFLTWFNGYGVTALSRRRENVTAK